MVLKPKSRNIRELLHQALKIANAVSVAILERLYLEAVDNGVLIPEIFDHVSVRVPKHVPMIITDDALEVPLAGDRE